MREKKKALILLTNDDGVYAPGLRLLFAGLAAAGETIIVAPDRDNSAVSHSLSLHRPLMVKELEANIYAINGTPADCVTIGVEKVLPRKPDLIVSGINAGANLGHDISYSGTVSAAKEGTIRGVPSMALSIAGHGPYHFDTGLQCAQFDGGTHSDQRAAGRLLSQHQHPQPEARGDPRPQNHQAGQQDV